MEHNGQEGRTPRAACSYLPYILGFCIIFCFGGNGSAAEKDEANKQIITGINTEVPNPLASPILLASQKRRVRLREGKGWPGSQCCLVLDVKDSTWGWGSQLPSLEGSPHLRAHEAPDYFTLTLTWRN